MPKLKLLSASQQKKFDSCPSFNVKQRKRYFTVNDDILEYIDAMRTSINQVGFLIQLGYFRASGKFFSNQSYKVNDIKFCCKVLELEYSELGSNGVNAFAYSAKVRSKHKKYILLYSGWKEFNTEVRDELHDELMSHAKHQMHLSDLVPIATKYLINCKIEIPMYYLLAKLISSIYNKIEDHYIDIIKNSILPVHREILDDLIWIDDKKSKHYKFSALSKIKQLSYSTKIKDIEESITNYKLLKAFHAKFNKIYAILNFSESATTYYSEWVIKSKLFQLKQFKNRSKAYLYLLAHLKHQYYKQTDLYVETLLKLVANANNTINKKLDDHNTKLMKLQKKAFMKLTNSHISSKKAFQNILSILNSSEKNFTQKDLAIREIIISQLYDPEAITGDNDKIIEEYLQVDVSAVKLRSALLQKMGSSLNRKLTPIICELDFQSQGAKHKLFSAINDFTQLGGKLEKCKINRFLSHGEIDFISPGRAPSLLAYKGLLFTKIYKAIKSGEININYSYSFLSIEQYLISDDRWDNHRDVILDSCGLKRFTHIRTVLSNFEKITQEKFLHVNSEHTNGSNKYLKIKSDGSFTVNTPSMKGESKRNKLAPVFTQEGIVPISTVLTDVNTAANFTKHFKHHSIKNFSLKPNDETIFAGIISKGCNHGHLKMANISKGVNKATLSNTINWFFSLENIQRANNSIIAYINKLPLPNIYKINNPFSHTSSDGQKFNVGVDSILANYSFKYFGQSQGISVYTFIDDRHVLFHDTILSPGEREAAFVIDGLMANNVVNSFIHSTDTHGYSEVIFAVMHFLGISFAPRIKKIGSQRLYCVDSKRNYNKKDMKIKPDAKININLIKDNWDDILKLIATIKSKTTTASQIFEPVNNPV